MAAWDRSCVPWLGGLPPAMPNMALLQQLPNLVGLTDLLLRHRGLQETSAGFLSFANMAAQVLQGLGWDARQLRGAPGAPAQPQPDTAAAGKAAGGRCLCRVARYAREM